MHVSHRLWAAGGAESAELANHLKSRRTLHAGTVRQCVRLQPACGALSAGQRKELERLCRYITRPAIANERLQRNRAGQVVLQLKSAFRDGTTHVVMSQLEFMQRLAALVPRPRLHLIRFHGVLAPHARLRAAVVPGKPSGPADEHLQASARMSWARLLKRLISTSSIARTAAAS